ncbi:MAG: gluconate 2-dehydrogenase subunit 3 family protein [Gemmatimonadetes bacterium]|nr:gluconate 2-dehydrogenase subunit 3 family protein [Gemmatimonadota bacterium]
MDRRQALRTLAAASAAPAFLHWDPDALIAGIREHLHEARRRARPRPPQPRSPYEFQILTGQQRATVAELSEIVIPATDTPGAKAARVDEFVDLILAEWATENDRGIVLNGLAALDARMRQATGGTFLEAAPAPRVAMCTQMDDELTAARAASRAWSRTAGTPRPPDHRSLFWHHMRSLTVSGYYTSEAGYTLERMAVLVPGIYNPCMPVAGR